jgi:hypothetical protein
MGAVEPRRALVVEIGQGALFEKRGGAVVDRRDVVREAQHDLWYPLDQIGRVRPRLAQLVEPPRRLGDRDSARIAGIIGGRDVWRQAFGKGVGFEAHAGCLLRIITDPVPTAQPQRPSFVEPALKNTE